MSADAQTLSTFGMIVDPMRPNDLQLPAGLAAAPPKCPACQNFLYGMSKNAVGDLLFECLNDGYETVYRVAPNVFEPRPGRDVTGWVPPIAPAARKLRTPVVVPPPAPRRTPVH